MGKGLLYTPGGSHHREHYPFTIDDFAWEELLKRKDEFLEKQANCEHQDEEQYKKQRSPR